MKASSSVKVIGIILRQVRREKKNKKRDCFPETREKRTRTLRGQLSQSDEEKT